MTRAFILFLIGVLTLARPTTARGDEVAPDLEEADLRIRAQSELRTLMGGMAPNDRRRLVGVYAAFDTNAGDPFAQIACDDDGDYVIVISVAMLRLAAHLARAATYDETNKSRSIDEYAAFLARSQIPGRPLFPPPPGFYVPNQAAAAYEDRLNEMLAFVVARELAHLQARDLVCPKPTATRESGDEAWTSAEQRKAAELAVTVYPGRQMERDAEATSRLLNAGRSEKGALALLRFFAEFEVESRISLGRFHPGYAMHHPNAAARASVVKHSAAAHVEGARTTESPSADTSPL